MDSTADDQGNSVCPGCGGSFLCGASAGKEACWCMELPVVVNLPADKPSCYCANCLREMLSVVAT